MADIFFSFREDIDSDTRARVLSQIRGLPGVTNAAQLKGDASRSALRAKCFARIEDEMNVQAALDEIRGLPEVVSAGAPARRGLP